LSFDLENNPGNLRRYTDAAAHLFFGGVALPGPYCPGSNPQSYQYDDTHDDPSLWHVHHVSTVSQTSNQYEITNEIQGKGHFYLLRSIVLWCAFSYKSAD
jgi:hypothetical protein